MITWVIVCFDEFACICNIKCDDFARYWEIPTVMSWVIIYFD